MDGSIDDRISDLPSFVIHNILSFLDPTAVARMATLSRRWAEVYASYPWLVFLERKYNCKVEFRRKVDFTLQRFYEQGLCLKRFQLNISLKGDDISLLDSWIELILKCDIEELDLRFAREAKNLHLQPYSLPGALFASKSITELRLEGCHLKYIDSMGVNQCSLRVLDLHYANIDEQAIDCLHHCCPYLEYISFFYCHGFRSLQVCGLDRLKTLVYRSVHTITPQNCAVITIEAPSLEALRFHCGRNCSCRVYLNLKSSCEYLKRLVFEGRDTEDMFLLNILTRSPCLEHLSLINCVAPNAALMISSPSLKSIEINKCNTLSNVTFYTPGLRSFSFGSTQMTPCSAISTPSGYWLANFRIEEGINNSWFQKLVAFTCSNPFKVLNVTIVRDKGFFSLGNFCRLTPNPSELDKLGLTMYISNRTRCIHIAALLDGFLCCFRPQLFYFRLCHLLPAAEVSEFSTYIHQQLSCVQEPSCCRSSRAKCWRHYLKGMTMVTEEINGKEVVSYRLQW